MNEPKNEKMVEGRDYYFENGLMVLTEHFLLKRGYCCESGCRHCPYGFSKDGGEVKPPTHRET
jgi:hypothetical protein